MTTDNYTLRIIKSDYGKYLTNADAVKTSDKVVSTEVCLAIDENPNRWIEITAEEAEAIRAEQEAERIKIEREFMALNTQTVIHPE